MYPPYCTPPTTSPVFTRRSSRLFIVTLLACLLFYSVYMLVNYQLHSEKRLLNLQSELHAINVELAHTQHCRRTDSPTSNNTLHTAQLAQLRSDLMHTSSELQRLRLGIESMRGDGASTGVGRPFERIDYALASIGGSVVDTGTSRLHRNALQRVLRVLSAFVAAALGTSGELIGTLAVGRNAPLHIIRPTTAIGECYGFYGTVGEVVLRLQRSIFIEAVSIDHIRADMAPRGNVNSAPRSFSVYGLHGLTGAQQFFGSFEYRIGEQVAANTQQVFEIPKELRQPDTSFDLVHILFQSNHGNAEYTCVYQVKVHGRPDDDPSGLSVDQLI